VGIYRNGWVSHTFGFHQGFDIYQRPSSGRPHPPGVKRKNPSIKDRGTDEDVISGALEFLRVDGHKRWFLYLHLMDVHEYTYDETSALFGSAYSDIYDNSIRWTDGTLGILFAHLAAGGHLENTLIAITSDHGEAFSERGYEGHAREVYPESTEVPFILSFPFRLEPGVVVTSRSRGVDVWPTMLDLLGLAAPSGLDGRSLVPELLARARGEELPEQPVVAIAHLDQTWGQAELPSSPTVALSDGPLRYIRINRGHENFEQLFDSGLDPSELEDQATERRDEVLRLRGLANDYLSATPEWGEAETRDLSELELNQLRALGYALP
jgi:arylsulfatase A-like enzyme